MFEKMFNIYRRIFVQIFKIYQFNFKKFGINLILVSLKFPNFAI